MQIARQARALGRRRGLFGLGAQARVLDRERRLRAEHRRQLDLVGRKLARGFIVERDPAIDFVLDDERLKRGKPYFGKDYFEELLERIREIRASERRFYQKVTDIYALSADYDPRAPITRDFFATVQNKLHWAITGQTAAELIYSLAELLRFWWAAPPVATWRRKLDEIMLRLKGLAPSNERSALVSEWNTLRSEDTVQALVRALRSAS